MLGFVIRIIIELGRCERNQFAESFSYKVGPITEKKSIQLIMPLDIIISTKQKAQVTLAPKGSDGKPFVLTAKPSWAVTAGSATLQVADDGLSAWLISPDSEGDSLIQVKDTTSGSTLQDQITLHADNATTPPASFASDLGLTLGAVQDK
jgi:hypothetical protein